MILGFGKVTCALCGGRVPRRDARRAQDGSRACVCDRCYAGWDRTGRKCCACNNLVRGIDVVGLFGDRTGLGHVDCGGARMLRA